MANEMTQAEALFEVVVNDEGQYSIWAANKTIPAGWNKAGKLAKKEECLAYIAEVWTDMRPLSLQRQMSASH